MVSNPLNSIPTTASTSSIATQSVFGSSSTSTQAPAPSAASSTFVFGQPATSSSDGPPAKAAFVFGQSQDGQTSAPSVTPLNSSAAPSPAQPFIFGVSASGTAPPAAAPSFGFGSAAPSVTSSSGLHLLMFSESSRCHFCATHALCFRLQLHLQLLHRLHSVQRHLVDLGPVRLLHLAQPLDPPSRHHLPKPPPRLEPVPIPLPSLESRPTPPLRLEQTLIQHQVPSVTVKYVVFICR